MLPSPFARVGAAALAICLFAGCGGGGGGDSSGTAAAPGVTPTAPPSQASASSTTLTSFLANGAGSIVTLSLDIDDAGNVASTTAGTHYQLQQTGTSGCSMSSNPTDSTIAACSVLAGGKAFLFCQSAFTPHYTVALFRQADVEVATHWELAGKTLTGIACGPTGPRATDYSFVISSDGEAGTAYTGLSTSGYGSGALDMMERTTTCTLTNVGFCERLLIYKIRNGTNTQYFLLLLSQMPATGAQRPVNLYFLQT